MLRRIYYKIELQDCIEYETLHYKEAHMIINANDQITLYEKSHSHYLKLHS